MISCWLYLVRRQLQAEARRAGIFQKRLRAVLGVAAITAWAIAVPPSAPLTDRAYLAFAAVSVVGLGLCLLAGLRHAVPELVEEIRSGTLDQLRQTEVTVRDFVLGKFAATFLQALCEILPLLPVLLLTAALSGSLVWEFWRVVLAFAAMLFSSVALAMLSAAFCRGERRALLMMSVLMLGAVVWWPLGEGLAKSMAFGPEPESRWFHASPIQAFRLALDAGFRHDAAGFYRAINLLLTAGVVSLALTAARLRLQHGNVRCPWAGQTGWKALLFRNRKSAASTETGKAPNRNASSTRRLPTSRSSLGFRGWGLSALPMAACYGFVLGLEWGDRAACEWSLAALWAAHLTVKALLGLEASCHLQEARRTGTLVLELATLRTAGEILDRSRGAVWQRYRWPGLALALANLAVLVALGLHSRSTFSLEEKTTVAAILMVGVIEIITDGYALFWFGMWLGLTSGSLSRALIRTWTGIVFVPWAALWGLAALNFGNLYTLNDGAAYLLCWTILGLSLSLILGGSAKQRLHRELRHWAHL